MPYDCFISYASADLVYAEELHRRLEAAGFKVWFDKVRLQPGFDWHREIEQGCENSRGFLPVLTPRWQLSDWTRYETYGAGVVIPLIFEGTWTDVCTPPLERFQAEIMDFSQADDATWECLLVAIRRELAQPPPQKVARIAHLRHLPNPYFVGREKDLIRIHEELHTNPRAVLTQGRVRAVVALGGVGKTTLARHYAEIFWRCYPQIFWVDARLPLETGFARLHDLLFPDRVALGLSDADKAARALYELNLPDTRLLIIDNAEDEQSVMAWLPRSGGCHTLITSRFAGWSAAVKALYLFVLDPEPAREFLLERTGRRDSITPGHPPGELAAVDELARQLGYLPLALEQAGAYIANQGVEFGFVDYLKLFAQAQKELLAAGALGSTEYPDSVITTWMPTVAKLAPVARAILRLAAFLAPTPIPLEYFVKSADLVRREAEGVGAGAAPAAPPGAKEQAPPEFYVREAVGQLGRYSMVQMEGHWFSVHPLVQTVERLNLPQEEYLTTLGTAVALMNVARPDLPDRPDNPDPKHRPTWELLLPHAECLIDHLRGTPGTALDEELLYSAAQAYSCRGWYQHAVDFGRETMILKRNNQETKDAKPLYGETNLGYWLMMTGQYKDAEEQLQRAIDFYKKNNNSDYKKLAIAVNILAEVYRFQGRYDESEHLFKRALEIRKKVLPADHPDVAASMNDLSVLYIDNLCRYGEAESLIRDCLKIWITCYGRWHPEVATGFNNLANIYRSQGNYRKAEKFHQLARAIRYKATGLEHPGVAFSDCNLAILYHDQGQYEKAEQRYLSAIHIWEKCFGPKHPHMAVALSGMARIYQAQGRYAEAEPLLQRALAIYEQVLGPEHPHTLISLFNLATSLLDKGEHPESARFYQQLVATQEKFLKQGGTVPPEILWRLAVSHNNLAFHTEVPAGNWAEAEYHYRRSLKLFHQISEPLEAANVELNLQTMFHLSGQPVDIPRVKELTRILEEAGDPSAEKGRQLLQELS